MSDAMTPAAGIDAADDAPEAADDASQTEAPEVEATRLGWRPKEDFKGPPEKWVDAEQFIARGKEILPFVQANNKALEKANKDLAAKISTMEKTFKEATAYFSKAEERGYKRAMDELQSRQDAAVEAGDTEAARAITKEIVDLTSEMKAPKPSDQGGGFTQSLSSWKAENPWFDADPDLKAFAIGVGESLKQTHAPEDQLPIIAQRVKAAFPAKFATENPRRSAPAAVETPQNGRRSATKTWADLPSEAKAMADRFIKNGFVASRDAYVKSYQWDS